VVAAAALFVALASAATARATVMVEVPLDEMVRDADAIVHGTVEQVGVRLVIDEHGATPHTLARLRVHEWIKGEGDDRIAIDEIGGVMHRGGMWIAGTPAYRRGDEVIVFLRRIDRGVYRTLAMAQGRFDVIHGVPGVDDIVQRDTSAIGFASWARGPMTIERGGRSAMRLDDFVGYLRSVIEQLALFDAASSDRADVRSVR
jgi:hypothetical protein